MRRRILPVLSVSAVLLTGLAGCSAGGAAASDCVNPLQPGALSDGVELMDIADGVPSVRIAQGREALNAQRTVLQEGEGTGRTIRGEDIVTANLTAFDTVTGEVIGPTQTRFLQTFSERVMPDLVEILRTNDSSQLQYTDIVTAGVLCAAPGDVLALTTTAAQSIASGLGYNPVVVVAEVLGAHGAAAEGSPRALPAGFPALTADETGRPGVVLPPSAAPGELRISPSIVGNGAAVTGEDHVVGKVLTVGWDGTERSNSWSSGPSSLGSEDAPGDFALRAELNGQTIGSRVVILDPNDGDPLVHVVDILAVG